MGWEKASPGQFMPIAPEPPAEASREPTNRKQARGPWMKGEAKELLRTFSSQLVGEVARMWFMPLIPELRRLRPKDGQEASQTTHDSQLHPVQGYKARYRGWGSHHFAPLFTPTPRTTTPCSDIKKGRWLLPTSWHQSLFHFQQTWP